MTYFWHFVFSDPWFTMGIQNHSKGNHMSTGSLLLCSVVTALAYSPLTHHHTSSILSQTRHSPCEFALVPQLFSDIVSSQEHSVITGIWLTQAREKSGIAAACVSITLVHPYREMRDGERRAPKSSQTNQLWACCSE